MTNINEPGKGPAYDLVVVDVDGTLLASDQAVTDEVREVVALVRESGVRLTLATGRVFCSAVQVARELAMNEPIISDGGAVVRHAATGEVLRDLRLPRAAAVAIVAALAAEGCDVHLFYPEEVLVSRPSAEAALYAARLGITMSPAPCLVEAVQARPLGPSMIVMRSTRERAPVLRARYHDLFGGEVLVTSTAPHFVDFLHHEAGKDRALTFLCERLGIPVSRVIAIGDGINDLDMIAAAGLGVLVANAEPELWPHADYVTKAPHYLGVAEVIRRFCLK